MLTENGTIKAKTVLDASALKELTRKPSVFALALMIIGGIGAGVFLVLDIIAEYIGLNENLMFVFLLIFAVFFGLGIGLKIILGKTSKTLSVSTKINEYEFFSDYFTVEQYVNGEQLARVKVYNGQVTKAKESKNYLFLYVDAAAYPVAVSELTQEELNVLRQMFKLPVKGGAAVLAAEKTETTQMQEKSESHSADPFGDFRD